MCSAFQMRGGQEREPEVMAGGRHQEQDEQGGDAERLEREADELGVVVPVRQLGDEIRQIVLHEVPLEQEAEMHSATMKVSTPKWRRL